MDELTKAEITEFWEGYGVKPELKQGYFAPDKREVYPPINLINLLKYAIDWNEVETIQFSKEDTIYHCWIYTKKLTGRPFHGNGSTEGDALFWVLREIKEKSNAK